MERGSAIDGSKDTSTMDLASVLERASRGVFPEDALLIETVSGDTADGESEDGFPLHQTANEKALAPAALTLALGLRAESPVHLLKKTPRNPFAGMITIGRAANNDVVVNHSSVSKFHAYVRVLGTDSLVIFDVGSTNGTRVDDRPVTVDGAKLATLKRATIGHRACIFIASADVRSWLTAQVVDTRTGARAPRDR
jgi:hypothetical protein